MSADREKHSAGGRHKDWNTCCFEEGWQAGIQEGQATQARLIGQFSERSEQAHYDLFWHEGEWSECEREPCSDDRAILFGQQREIE